MATQPAILGALRLGNARLGYNPSALVRLRATRIRVYLGGVLANDRVRRKDLTIEDVINDTPSTCRLTVDTTAPSVSQALRITINSDTPRLLFAGAIQTVDTAYDGDRSTNLCYHCTAIDDLERLKRRRVFGAFTAVSATTVVQTLAASYAPGFTTTGVEAGLPDVTVLFDGSEGWDGALKQLATLIGGYYYIEDLDIHLFRSESSDLPDPVDASHSPLTAPTVAIMRDLTQLRTRVYGKGYGSTIPTAVALGETIIPIDVADAFNLGGGAAIALTQRLTYTGVQVGGAGSFVGPSAAPSVAPVVTLVSGSGLGTGAYQYAYTDITAAGESLPSPLAAVTTRTLTAPASAPSVNQADPDAATTLWLTGETIDFKITYSAAASSLDFTQTTPASGVTSLVSVAASYGPPSSPPYARDMEVGVVHSSDSAIKWVHAWRQTPGGGGYRLATVTANVPGATTFESGGRNTYFAYTFPGSTTTALQQVAVSGIAIGASPTTSRKVYRTAVGGAQLKLLTTIADNTTTTYSDSTADGSLGANVPTVDTSGIVQTAGQVNAGSTSLLLSSAGPFSASGGWVQLGSQSVRYTGVSGNTLTGIPASGIGSLINTAKYGEHADPVPALTGVAGVVVGIQSGTPINIWVQRDDPAAQAAMAAIDGGDGIYEYLVSDERRNETSLTALCDANLQIFGLPIVTVTYAKQDVKTKSGKPVTFTSILGYTGTLTIQRVSITNIDRDAGIAPTFTATASSVRVSVESVLKALLGEGA